MQYIKYKHCPLCHSDLNLAEIIFELNENQTLLSCKKCSLIFNSCCVSDISSIYNEDYYQSEQKDNVGGYFSYDRMEKAILKTYRFAIRFIRNNAYSKQMSILDVGCGYGFILKYFRDISGFDICGVELSEKAALEAMKITPNIIQEPIENIKFDKSFDFITAFELIEHLINPVLFFEIAAKLLKDKGYLFITTPNIASLWFTLLKKRWPGIHHNYHNVYFSPLTIKTIANQCGFEIISIKNTNIFYINARHVRSRLLELFPVVGNVFAIFKCIDNLDIPFLNGGDMQIILRKI